MINQTDASTDKNVRRLYLSSKDRRILGVCGGIGEFFDVDPTLVRLAWIILTIMTGIVPGIIAYLIVGIITPSKPKT